MSELSSTEQLCPIGDALLSALQDEYTRRIELHTPSIEDRLTALRKRLGDAPPTERSYEERRHRARQALAFAAAESYFLATELGIERQEAQTYRALFDHLIESCDFEKIEIALREKPGAAPLRREHVERAKLVFGTAAQLVQYVNDHSRAREGSAEEMALSRRCGEQLAKLFSQAELAFEQRLFDVEALIAPEVREEDGSARRDATPNSE
ncbi:hypothetical protein LVJ94_35380 [Pendulispora rubella]|uniref:Haloacid dehalogenase n=1 Tax=Pendulispora rubella TaxID=2741070 RepID=A0ABZ2KYV7_9BACT